MSDAGMNAVARYATAISSIGIRLGAYIFLRWGFPPAIFALLAVYVPSLTYNLTHTSPYTVIADELDIVTKDVPEADFDEAHPQYSDGVVAEPIQEIDVEETIVLEEKQPEVLKTLLTGLPSPTSLLWSAINFAVNLALVAMVADFLFRGTYFHQAHDLSMARVGYVSDHSAKILVREPDANKYPVTVSYRYVDAPYSMLHGGRPQNTAWIPAGSIEWLDDRTDFTGTLELKRLASDTRYQWAASNNQTGYFVTAPRTGHISQRVDSAGTFTFLHTSCLKNNFPYNPFSHTLSNQGLRYLSQVLPYVKAQFMLFLGDFIYIDVPRRHGSGLADYRREYRQIYASPDWPAATQELPWIHVYDDHEVANDWDRNTTGIFSAAFDPYTHYHTSVNPPAVRKGESYFSFTQGPATFFMIDTRRYRSPNDATNGSDPITGDATKTMLGAQQLADLLAWLEAPVSNGVKWKVLVSSIPFTKNWWFGAQDTWRGYLGERQVILEAMWDVGLQSGDVGVIVLSGDRHEFAATAFPPPPDGKEEIIGLGPIGVGANALNPRSPILAPQGNGKPGLLTRRKRWPLSSTVHEFSASPLNMFYLPIRTYAESSTSEDYLSDVCIKYIPDGNSKFGAVSISNPRTSDQSVLHYRLFVDGLEKWSYTLTSPPETAGGSREKDAIWG
ncbi:hypothetical protein LTR78_000022 [Recurvomyces mirabilis]|uniref:PhoD-like phosphatase metallophosphatase domain-containing protein n=1 Tax=Recurvomyces mirabilis TaxID=574656 RepID=A0AAE0WWG3_9PEZI|nr:hypothetical protein LTR78_000022 [Recurvomyces mirabilis]KAK5161679.1 hypothetical protein LTS14_000023 [Recurvomyces mirabilis]